MTKVCCAQCSKPVTFARFSPESNAVEPGDYHIVAISREGSTAYGRTANYVNVYVHIGECETAWRAANGNGTLAADEHPTAGVSANG